MSTRVPAFVYVHPIFRPVLVLLLPFAFTLSVAVAPAAAWTSALTDGQLAVTDDQSRPDRFFVTLGASGDVEVDDEGAPFAGAVPAACSYDTEAAVLSCPRTAVRSFVIDAAVGDDSVDVTYDLPSALLGGPGADSLSGAAGEDVLLGGPGSDSLDGGGGQDQLDGGDDGDSLDGADGADVLAGGVGDDALDGGPGDDRLDGGPGTDAIDGAQGADLVDGGSGDDRLDGGDGTDLLTAGAGADVLDGDAAEDRLDGGDGDDRLDDGADADLLEGGSGSDALVTAGTGDRLEGGDGSDALDAEQATGPTRLSGGPGDDSLLGGPSADILSGDEGRDRLAGGAGPDILGGGADRDTVTYEEAGGPLKVTVGSGADDGERNEADDVLGDVEEVIGGDGGDTLVAGSADATLQGSGGDDRLIGGVGNDELRGGDGDDRLDGRGGGDALAGEEGRDTVWYADRSRPLTLLVGNDSPVSGEAGEGDRFPDPPELVLGGRGADRIVAAQGIAHRIVGGAGDDLLIVDGAADAAPDAVRCGSGNDEVRADRFDTYERLCERVLIAGRDTRPRTGLVPGAKLHVSAGARRGFVRLQCGARTRSFCVGRVAVSRTGRSRAYAEGTFRIGAGDRKAVSLRITRTGQRRLSAGGPSRLRMRITARDGLGRGSTRVLVIAVRRGRS